MKQLLFTILLCLSTTAIAQPGTASIWSCEVNGSFGYDWNTKQYVPNIFNPQKALFIYRENSYAGSLRLSDQGDFTDYSCSTYLSNADEQIRCLSSLEDGPKFLLSISSGRGLYTQHYIKPQDTSLLSIIFSCAQL